MTDVVSPKKRSMMMAGIKGKNTKPELTIRSELHKRGYRFRLHYSALPGKPDIVLPKYKSILLINGCFWHQHDCHLFKWPKTRTEFWQNKISETKERDLANLRTYENMEWRTLLIWECALKGKTRINIEVLMEQIEAWLTNENCSKSEITGSGN